MNHEHSTHSNGEHGNRIDDPLGLRLEAGQGERREPKDFRGRTVGHSVAAIYQDVALANADQFNEWRDGLSDSGTREKAGLVWSWAFWAHQGIFTPPERSYGEFVLCWLIERGCPSGTLAMIRYGFKLEGEDDD